MVPGTDRSTELAASAWSALLVVSKSCSREYQSEILALPWVLLQRQSCQTAPFSRNSAERRSTGQIPAMHALFPAALIQAILKAAVLYAHEQLEAGTIQTQSLDRLIAGFLSSYDLTM